MCIFYSNTAVPCELCLINRKIKPVMLKLIKHNRFFNFFIFQDFLLQTMSKFNSVTTNSIICDNR